MASSNETKTFQQAAQKELTAAETEAKVRLERRQLEMLIVHALKISGGDFSLLLSPIGAGTYAEQFVQLEAAASQGVGEGFKTHRDLLTSRKANSVTQQVMRSGVVMQGTVAELGVPVQLKDKQLTFKNFVLLPVDSDHATSPVLLVANPNILITGKMHGDILGRLEELADVISKRNLHRQTTIDSDTQLQENNVCEYALKQLSVDTRHAIVTVSIDGVIKELNPAAAKLFSCKSRQALGEDFSRYLAPKYFMPTLQRLAQSTHETDTAEKLRLNNRSVTVLDESGDVKSVAASAYYTVENNQVSVTFVFSHPSVIRRSMLGESSVAKLVDTGLLGVVELDTDWHCENTNDAWCKISGLSQEQSKGMGWAQTIHDEDLLDSWVGAGEALEKGDDYSGVWRFKQPDGSVRWVAINASVVTNELNHAQGYLFVCQDVSSFYQTRQRLHHASTHDALTGLLNRSEFLGQLQLRLNTRNQRRKTSLVLLHVEGLRSLNREFGQGVGDQALRQFSGKLQATVGDATQCARMSGSQFSVLIKQPKTTVETSRLVDQLVNCVGGNFDVYGQGITLKVSVGFASADERTDCVDQLLVRADAAMRQTLEIDLSKCLDSPVSNTEEFDSTAITLEQRLAEALQDSSSTLNGEPLYSLDTGSLIRHEASLIRELYKPEDVLTLG